MPESMFGLLSYGEQAVDMELMGKHKELCRFLTEAEVTNVAWQVTDKYMRCAKAQGSLQSHSSRHALLQLNTSGRLLHVYQATSSRS